MSDLGYKVIGNSPQGKPRVYFCCHKEDFDTYFDEISEEILNMQTCAIWYRKDFESFSDELENDLKHMQLFVIPVTAKFLMTENQALNDEFKIAVKYNIPVLPLMQEPGLEQMFNLKCGNIQFLNPHAKDATEIRYENKLKKYLEAVSSGICDGKRHLLQNARGYTLSEISGRRKSFERKECTDIIEPN